MHPHQQEDHFVTEQFINMHLHNNAATGDYWYTCDQCSSIVAMQQKARQGTSPREREGAGHMSPIPLLLKRNSYLPLLTTLSVFPYFSSVLSRGLINDCKTTTKKITVIYLNTESNNGEAWRSWVCRQPTKLHFNWPNLHYSHKHVAWWGKYIEL